MVYCLLPGKSREIYNQTFTLLKEALQNVDLELNPQHIMSDFELALIQSIRINFPATSHKGCFYHFWQCIWRKIQALGLQQQYQNDAELRKMLCKTAAIAFVPVHFVRVAWEAVAQELEDMDNLDGFKTYFDSTWMRGQFSLPLWNYYSYDGPRTNNCLEGWHNRLKRMVKKPHPNIYKLIDVFKREQAASEVTLQQLETGANPPPRKKKYRQLEQRVERIKEKMSAGQMSISEYLDAIGHLIGL